jgi:hypothetical protein
MALGMRGGSLGYEPLSPSVAVELDTHANSWDPDDNHIGLLADGDVITALVTVSPPFTLDDGVLRYLWIDFDGGTGQVEVYVADSPTRPNTAVLEFAGLDLAAPLGFSCTWAGRPGSTFSVRDVVGPAYLVAPPRPKCR